MLLHYIIFIIARYLATGETPFSIGIHHLVGESTVFSIIKDTCAIISNVLAPIYLNCPTEEEWQEINNGFTNTWNMPNCIGTIDGKHIVIKAPANSGSQFFNYKKAFSIVLMAVCNHKYQFPLVDVGSYGSESDGRIFTRSAFGQALSQEKLNLPKKLFNLCGCDVSTPCYLVGDEAFGISPRMMRPYPRNALDISKRVFNYRLSRARRIIENGFGILTARWRILHSSIGLNVTNVDRVVMATVCLHNFFMIGNEKRAAVNRHYCPSNYIDNEDSDGNIISGAWREGDQGHPVPINTISATQATKKGYRIRENLKDYFMSPEGQIPW